MPAAGDSNPWEEQWVKLAPRPEWENPEHWLGARGVMTAAFDLPLDIFKEAE